MEEEIEKKSFFKKWGLIVLLSLALLVMIVDTTMISVSISNISIDLNSNLKDIQWAITIYSLVMAAFMLLGGKIGDIYGRKKAFVIGAVIYGIGTLTAAFSPNITSLITGWSVIEGIGSALMMPATISLLLANYSGKDRKIAFGIWGGMAGAAAAIGPLFGGWVTTNLSWRWGFGSEIIIVILILSFAHVIKESKSKDPNQSLDYLGMVLSSLGVASLVYGFIEASTYGWWKAKEIYTIGSQNIDIFGLSISAVTMIIGVILIAIFIWWQKKREKNNKTPLLDLNLFRTRSYSTSIVTLSMLVLSQMGLFFILPVFLQSVRHLTAFETGVALLPMSITIFIASGAFAKISQKIPAKYIIQVGLVLSVISVYLLKNDLSVDVTKGDLALGLALFGLGMGMVMSQLMNVLLSDVPVEKSGTASGVMTTMRTLSGSLGTAIIGSILIAALVANVTTGIEESQIIPTEMKPLISDQIELRSQSFSNGGSAEANMTPPAITEEIVNISNKAQVDANKEALNWTIILMGMTVLVSFLMPKNARDDNPLLAVEESES